MKNSKERKFTQQFIIYGGVTQWNGTIYDNYSHMCRNQPLYLSLAQYCCNLFLLNYLELMSTELPAGEAIVRQPGN